MWEVGTEAGRPAFGVVSRLYFATDTGRVFRDTGSAWEPTTLVHRGAWSSATTYQLHDLVTSAGSVWRALRSNTNVTPVEGADWTLFVSKGDAGPAGGVSTVFGRSGAVVAATSDYDAVQIDYAGSTNLSATNVEAALDELDTEKAAAGDLTAHINDTSDAHDASAISYAGGTGMAATDAEAAIDELATEKVDTTRTISTTAPLSGGGDLSANRTLSLPASTETQSGHVELATAAETETGSSTSLATHPAGVAAAMKLVPREVVFARDTLATGAIPYRWMCPYNITILYVRITAWAASSSGSITADLNKATNAAPTTYTTMYTTQGNRPSLAASAYGANATLPDVTTASAGDYLQVDLDAIGTGASGFSLQIGWRIT